MGGGGLLRRLGLKSSQLKAAHLCDSCGGKSVFFSINRSVDKIALR